MIVLIAAASLAFAPVGELSVTRGSSHAARVLPNGLTVVVRPRPRLPIVAIDLWVHAGTGREAASEEGAAHFVEHLLFRGTTTRASGDSDAAIEDMGGVLNAGTTRDGARVFTTVPADSMDEALEVIADMAMRPLLRDSDVDIERRVIVDEEAAAAADTDRSAVDALMARLFPGHGYGRPLLGSREALAQISGPTVRAFHARCWTPRGAVLALVGDVEVDRAMASAERAFGSWTGAPAPAEEPLPAVAPGAQQAAGASAGRVVLGWAFRIDGLSARERAVFDVLAAIAGAAPGGRLRRELAAAALAGYPLVEARHLRTGGVLSVLVGCESGRLAEVRAALDRVFAEVAREAPTDDEMRHAVRWLAGRSLFDLETVEGEARMVALAELVGAPLPASAVAPADAAVRPAEVHALSARLLVAERRAEVVLPLMPMPDRAR
ncbi:MAG TPA: insulinase family protein [Chthonomonadales bacterium]|nr:insulinase family protein [Chthonomonadales bacterium]